MSYSDLDFTFFFDVWQFILVFPRNFMLSNGRVDHAIRIAGYFEADVCLNFSVRNCSRWTF